MSLMREDGVNEVSMDQCQFGQKAVTGEFTKKPTRWIFNSAEVLKTLGKKCTGRGGNVRWEVCTGDAKEATRGGQPSTHSYSVRPF